MNSLPGYMKRVWWRWTTSKFRKLIELDWTDRLAVTAVVLLIPTVKILLRILGFSTTQTVLPRLGSSISGQRLSELIRKVEGTSWVPHLNCLERSLVIWSILGEPATIRFGVQPTLEGQIPRFHAWVESDGVLIGSEDHVGYREFVPVTNHGPKRRSKTPKR